VLKDKVKKGGMYFITNSDRFEKLTKLKDKQQLLLKNDLDKNGEPQTMGGEAAKTMVNMYNQNITLLNTTIDKYIEREITDVEVREILDNKIEEIKKVPTGLLKDAEQFKKAALDLLTWLRSDVSPWLI
jgi:S-adenosylmethionine synthetase